MRFSFARNSIFFECFFVYFPGIVGVLLGRKILVFSVFLLAFFYNLVISEICSFSVNVLLIVFLISVDCLLVVCSLSVNCLLAVCELFVC